MAPFLIFCHAFNFYVFLRWTNRPFMLDIFGLEMILVPLNFNNIHWVRT